MGLETFAALVTTRFIERFADHYAHRLVATVTPAPPATSIEEAFNENRLQSIFRSHLLDVANWAGGVQMYVMPQPRRTTETTVPLDFVDVPRKFRMLPSDSSTTRRALVNLDEDVLLEDKRSQVLLGDPGAGKTTTIKRIVGKLLSVPEVDLDHWSVPIVVRLREHATLTSVCDVLVSRLGISTEMHTLSPPAELPPPPYVDDDSLTVAENQDRRREADRHRSWAIARWDEAHERCLQILAMLLDRCGAILFLDGLDEVRPGVRAQLEASIEALGRLMSHSKIVVSCRSGDYGSTLDGFTVIEINPLTQQQVEAIATLWLERGATNFMQEVRAGAAAELVNRPLFLTQMLALYANTESVPDQPSALCRQMVRLAIQDWDRHRRTIRTTKYKGFDSDSKLEFLANMAYLATFELQKSQLTHEELIACYDKLHDAFGLPPNEADQVASELETHTGLIVQAGYRRFEFSHLSVQEYLAAEHLVRVIDRFSLMHVFGRSPSTVAVSVALSSDPATYLANMCSAILTSDTYAEILDAFLYRLMLEKPRFRSGAVLGCAALWLVVKSWQNSGEAIRRFLDYPGVFGSLHQLLAEGYTTAKVRTHGATIVRRDSYYVPGTVLAPDEGVVPIEVLRAHHH